MRKRKIFWIITILSPFLFLILLELILRWRGYGDNLDLTFVQEIKGKQYYTINQAVVRRYFPSHTSAAPKVYDHSFEVQKSPQTYRIFCIGESTMQGFPYEYNGALPVLLKDRLVERFTNKRIEVINLGITAINSYAVRDLVKEVVNYEPDLIILYVGHNEFYGSFGVGSIEYLGKNRTFVNFYFQLNRLKLTQLVRNTIAGIRSILGNKPDPVPSTALMELMAREKEIVYGSDLYERAKENFRENLEDIVAEASYHSVNIMLSTVVSNVRDQFPFVSVFTMPVTEEQKQTWQRHFDAGVKLHAETKYAEALEQLKISYEIDSTRADLQYEMAWCVGGLGDTVGARQHFERARDYDALRFRASGEFNGIIRDVAARHNVFLADAAMAFERHSYYGITGKELMLEHVHPTLDGYELIAKEFVNTMQSHNCIAPSDQWRPAQQDEYYMYVSLMTLFDIEASLLRIDNLRHHWPFSVPDSLRYRPSTGEGMLATRYLAGQLTWEQAHYRLADVYMRQKELAKAIREYLALAKEFWFDYRPLIAAGDISMMVKDYTNAEQYFKAALEREDNQFTQVRFGALYQEQNQPERAVKYYQTALEIDASATSKFKQEWKLQVMLHLGQAFLQIKEFDKAKAIAKEALAIDPQFNEAVKLLTKIEVDRLVDMAE